MAVTTHHRRADLSKGIASTTADKDSLARENRYALDGKWDVGIGLWFEGSVVQQSSPTMPSAYTDALTVGADYTFGLGNGLHVLGEYFVQEIPPEILGQRVSTKLSAASLSYPLGLLDSLSGILYVDTERSQVYRFVNWQRTYDRWQFYLMGFWNPRELAINPQSSSIGGRSLLAGKGFQIMAVLNHGTARSARMQR
jgi:hypothetical protein